MEKIEQIQKQFPLLEREKSLAEYVYFDNSATTQKPSYVIHSITDYYTETNSNVHRGIHRLSNNASILYEKAHEIVAKFIGANTDEVFFVKNTSEGINLLAQMLSESIGIGMKSGDVIVLNEIEHHSNILPWLKYAAKCGFIVEWLPVTGKFELDLAALEILSEKYKEKLRIVSVAHISNVLGMKNDIRKIATITHKYGGILVVDAAQSVAHLPIDVKELDVDFLVFSGHKIYSPMGSGALYGKKALLEKLEPAQVGGGMILDVEKDGADWIEIPGRFEVGTPSVADAIGFAAGLIWFTNSVYFMGGGEYVQNIECPLNVLEEIKEFDYAKFDKKKLQAGWERLMEHEFELMNHAIAELKKIPSVKIFGTDWATKRYGALSFEVEGIHPHDIASMLDEKGIAIRAGMHCAHLLHKRFGVKATSRISFGMYNTVDEIDYFLTELKKLIDVMK
jgi:cysteine desulfurase/selenocysteine lyase